MKRILTAVVLAPIITYIAIWAPFWAFLPVLIAVAFLCFYEYSGIVEAHGITKPGPFGFAAGLATLLSHFTPNHEITLVVLIALFALSLATFDTSDLRRVLMRAAAIVFGVVYIFGSWRCAIGLRIASPHWLFFALALNWIGDTGAMYAGRTLGRHKLAPVLSPKKSWEGSIASVLLSIVFGAVYLPRVIAGVSIWEAVIVAAVANIAGQVGDLSESALKRGAGMKDSGTLLPGHGGWLDRVDSSLFAVPVVYAWVMLRSGFSY
jgi:phosphatidate cytidylyltransferase